MNTLLVALLLTQVSAEPQEPPYNNGHSQRFYSRLTHLECEPSSLRWYEEAALELVRREPQSAVAWWASGFGLCANGVGDANYLRQALELGITGERRAQTLFALAAISSASTQKDPRADRWFEDALADSWNNPRLLSKGASYLVRMKDDDRARRVLTRRVELQPADPQAHAQYALVLTEAGEDEAALRQVKLARAGGVAMTDFELLQKQARHAVLVLRLKRLLMGLVLVLSLSLLGLYVAGSLLSRIQLRRLAAVDARLLRKEQTPRERLIDRLYSLVLLGASLPFYVFALSVGVLSVGSAWAVVTGPSLKLGVLLALSLWGLWGLTRLVRLRESGASGRRVLLPSEAPSLFRVLEEVARMADMPPPHRVYLEADASISVAEEGGIWKVLTGRGRRVLSLGFAALQGMSISELKTIIAHEYGHFSHGEMRLTPIVHRTLEWVAHTLRSMAAAGGVRYLNPWYGFLRAYFFVYLGVSQGHSRRRELLADRSAALAYGGSTFGTALTKAVRNGDLFGRLAGGTLMLMRRTGRPCEDLYSCLSAADALTPKILQTLRTRELTARKAHAYDSHPSPNDRIHRVAGIRGQKPLETTPALTLFAAPERLAQELTRELCTRLVNHVRREGGRLPRLRTDVGPDLQKQFASAFSLFQDALELREREHSEADATMLDGARLVEASVEPNEPLLVNVLQEAAGAYHRRGDSAAAEAALQRAKAVVEADPDPNPDGKRELLRELEQQIAYVGGQGQKLRAPPWKRFKAPSGTTG